MPAIAPYATPGPTLRIDVWSDYVCPFCYLELPVLDAVAAEFGAAVQVHWRAFELRPDPVATLDPAGEYLRTTWDRAVYPMAAERGMTLRLPPVQPRSRLAMEAAEHARAERLYEPMHRALFAGFFEHGLDIGRIEVLVDIGRSVGLAARALDEALQDSRHTEQVLRDQRLAQQLGVSGVPMMVLSAAEAPLHDAVGLSGAQPPERVRGAVRNWLARHAAR